MPTKEHDPIYPESITPLSSIGAKPCFSADESESAGIACPRQWQPSVDSPIEAATFSTGNEMPLNERSEARRAVWECSRRIPDADRCRIRT